MVCLLKRKAQELLFGAMLKSGLEGYGVDCYSIELLWTTCDSAEYLVKRDAGCNY
jgi:hypothetical protein